MVEPLPLSNKKFIDGGKVVNFDFSDEQKSLKEQARKFLDDRSGSTVVRQVLDGEQPYAKTLWKEMAEMGWLGTTIPEEYGGAGLVYLELCVLAEEVGRTLAPVPFSSSVYLASEVLLMAGSNSQKEAWLPKLAAGETIATLALSEGVGRTTEKNLQCTFSNGVLNGTKVPVSDGLIADIAIVTAINAAGKASLVLVELDDASVSREEISSVDMVRRQATITFKQTPAVLLGEEGQGWAVLTHLLNKAAVLFAFEQIGGADRAMEMARDYALGRYAFGRAIGSFQAIKHKLADMYIKNELARSNSYFGAWALSSDAEELPLAAATARVSATQAFDFAAKENLQIHGGMGYTWEFDCHLYYRRSKLTGLCLGSQIVWKEKLVKQLEQQAAVA